MRNLLILFAVLSFACPLSGQDKGCGTVLSKKQEGMLRHFHPEEQAKSARISAEAVRNVAITAHLIRRNDGTGGLTAQQLADAITVLNDYYVHADIGFFLAGTNEIPSTQYFDFVTDDEVVMGNAYDVPNTINIYFANTVKDANGSGFCGYAYFPGGPDRILMDNSCAINGSTLPHEVGHFFTLYHTHGKTNGTLTDELVARTNCETAGDELCDTAADPELGGQNVNSSCIYFGTKTDANGALFTPDPRNLMSYSLKQCRNVFTDGQYSRMSQAYDAFRSYLYSKMVVAAFDENTNEPCEGSSVSYSSSSLNATSWSWFFEGGTPQTSTEEHPVVLYSNAGVFDVQLVTADGNGNKDTLLMADHITVIAGVDTELISSTSKFEGATIGLEVDNPDGQKTFELTSTAAAGGVKSVMVNFYDYGATGQEDYLLIPFMDNSFSRDYRLSFDYAYTYFDNTYYDQLSIVYRSACNPEWTSLWSKSGAGLSTRAPLSTSFVPGKAEWKHVALDFTVPEDMPEVELAFKAINGYGNNLYLDNIDLKATMEVMASAYTCPEASDGSISVASSGTQSYEYSINGQVFQPVSEFTNLASGSYTVTVRDALGRIYIEQVSIGSSALSISTEDISCHGDTNGSASFAVSGGSAGYQYTVDDVELTGNTASGLTAGQHTFEMMGVDNGCVLSGSFEILEPGEISMSLSVSDATCYGGEGAVVVDAVGGSGDLAYQIDAGPLVSDPNLQVPAGDFLLTVIDANECATAQSFQVSQPDSLYFMYEASGFFCKKETQGELVFTAFGGAGGYAYTLDDAPLEGSSVALEDIGAYEVTIEDANGCTFTQQITLDYEFPTPKVPVIRQSGSSLVIDDTEADILWYSNGTLLEGETSTSIPLEEGVYQVVLSYEGGFCEVGSEEFVVLSVGQALLDMVSIAPNPIGERFEVLVPEGISDLEVLVYNMSGQLVHSSTDLLIYSPWPKGVYLVKVRGEGAEVTRRVVKP